MDGLGCGSASTQTEWEQTMTGYRDTSSFQGIILVKKKINGSLFAIIEYHIYISFFDDLKKMESIKNHWTQPSE